MKFLLGILVAAASAAPAFALPLLPRPHPVPVPLPELAVGAPAVIAVIGAYLLARLLVPARSAQKADIS